MLGQAIIIFFLLVVLMFYQLSSPLSILVVVIFLRVKCNFCLTCAKKRVEFLLKPILFFFFKNSSFSKLALFQPASWKLVLFVLCFGCNLNKVSCQVSIHWKVFRGFSFGDLFHISCFLVVRWNNCLLSILTLVLFSHN